MQHRIDSKRLKQVLNHQCHTATSAFSRKRCAPACTAVPGGELQPKTRNHDNTASRDCAVRAAEIARTRGKGLLFAVLERGTIFGGLPVAALHTTHPGWDGHNQPADSEAGNITCSEP
jgi:hypothetical protein